MKKEDFIETILNSTNNMVEVYPDDSLFDKIQMKIKNEKRVESYTKWLVAASVFLLVSLNIGILSNSNKDKKHDLPGIDFIADNQIYLKNE